MQDRQQDTGGGIGGAARAPNATARSGTRAGTGTGFDFALLRTRVGKLYGKVEHLAPSIEGRQGHELYDEVMADVTWLKDFCQQAETGAGIGGTPT